MCDRHDHCHCGRRLASDLARAKRWQKASLFRILAPSASPEPVSTQHSEGVPDAENATVAVLEC